jgi:hypothetical protein
MSAFLSGRDLSRRFYEETVRPLLTVIQSTHDTAHAVAVLHHLPIVG